jgi:hypothetical protein
MADDDDMIEGEPDAEDELDDAVEGDGDIEIDPDELDEEALEEDDAFALDDDDDEFAATDDDEDDDAVPETDSDGPVRRSVSSDEDEDDDMLAPDDVEADLDTILKDRLVAADDEGGEDEEEEPEDRTEGGDRLQPKRADEQLCPSCFLLVRQNAPTCPVGDDDCPLKLGR